MTFHDQLGICCHPNQLSTNHYYLVLYKGECPCEIVIIQTKIVKIKIKIKMELSFSRRCNRRVLERVVVVVVVVVVV